MKSSGLFSLTDRVAVVTGAAAGLGRAMAEGMAAHGATVVVVDRDSDGAAETCKRIADAGGKASPFAADLSDPKAIEALFAFVEKSHPRLDILVNNAANSEKAPAETIALDVWDHVMRLNTTAYLLTAQAAFRLFRRGGRGGSIINISSIAGINGMGRDSLAYSVSKAAVNQLTRELAVEWGTYGIRVNAIMPCQFMTPALRRYLDTPAGQGILPQWLDGIPMGRLGEVDDIVGPAVFLASPAAAMVTGHLLAVDGGNLATNASGTVRKDKRT
jgi:NAD(P)-dependent dehydrogenase (short-subunit alcohol dehydrogenase family)